MDDDFLLKVRPPVRKEFADALFQQLSSQIPVGQFSEDSARFPKFRSAPAFKLSWHLALLAVLVMAIVTISLSQPARAMALKWIRAIAGFVVEERQESPLKGLEEGGESGMEQTIPAQTPLDVLTDPPFSFGMPEWIPGGYTLDATAAVANSRDWIILTWTNPNGAEITLLVERKYTGYNIPAGESSSQEVQLEGQPALLIQGNWNDQHQWDPQRGLALYWMKAGRGYRLVYSERDAVKHAIQPIQTDLEDIQADLVQMAESIP